jgi:hypothetical protein
MERPRAGGLRFLFRLTQIPKFEGIVLVLVVVLVLDASPFSTG